MRVLVADGDVAQANDIESMLREVNITCSKVQLGEDALEAMAAQRYDCLVVSSLLPDMTIEEFLAQVPEGYLTPIVYLSNVQMGMAEKVRVLHKVDALVIKPFKKAEMINKVVALIDPYEQQSDDTILYYYKLSLDVQTGNVSFANKHLVFNDLETSILEVLMRNPDELVTNDEIRAFAFGGAGPSDEQIDAAVEDMTTVLFSTTGHRYLQTIEDHGHRLWHPPWMRAMPLSR